MADSIRGLTVEISADASSFNKEMSQMRKAAQSSQSELAALQKSLDLEFDATKLARAQKVAQDAIDKTAANADVLRRRLEYLEKTGNADTSEYRKLQTELAQTELKGQQLQKQLEKLNTLKFDKLSSRITGVGDKITGAGRALAPFSAAAGAVETANAAAATADAATERVDELEQQIAEGQGTSVTIKGVPQATFEADGLLRDGDTFNATTADNADHADDADHANAADVAEEANKAAITTYALLSGEAEKAAGYTRGGELDKELKEIKARLSALE